MRRLTRYYPVLFVNSLGMRVPSLKKDASAMKKIARKLWSIARFLKKVDRTMFVLSPAPLPFLGSSFGQRLNARLVRSQLHLVMRLLGIRKPIFYIGCPPALDVIRNEARRFLIYQRTDLFEEMPGINRPYITSLDQELAESADLVLYVNKALWQSGLTINKNSLLLGHGVDFDMFVEASDCEYCPEDIAVIPRPRIGFFGDISDKTLDLELLAATATKLPSFSFVLVGPVSADVGLLRGLSNVHFLGQKPYEQIPFYGKEFDVAIMPWNQNRWIQFCNPVKAKEYLALGMPIVSTYYPEVEPYRDVIYVAGGPEEFAAAIETALKENDPAKRTLRREKVKDETWDSKAEKIRSFIDAACAAE